MPELIQSILGPDPACRSRQVGWFLTQLEDQARALRAATRDLTPAELEWQPAPGVNSIGMLLAHIAVAEVHLVQVGVMGQAENDVRPVLGIGAADDGIPLAPGAAPPEVLRGRDLEFYDGLLARARAHTRPVLAGLEDADLDRRVERPRPDGSRRRFNVGWLLSHLADHQSTHLGQITLLQRMARSGR
ncbi:MAG TPA: DinB family protein [Candidatus Saccharimonadales bacterium]|nr:DinB family protein [Candidatus Saccharimonadales bacterium]